MGKRHIGRRAGYLICAVALLAAVALSSGATRSPAAGQHAKFEFFLVKWKSHTFKYFNAAKSYSTDVKAAAAAWNSSGARLKWKAVPRKRADIVITTHLSPRSPFSGLTATNGTKASIAIAPGLRGGAETPEAAPFVPRTVIAHEMGHVIGLGHEDDVCAAMNSVPFGSCGGSAPDWLYRCSFLYADDIRGAVRLFGGKVRKLPPEFCQYKDGGVPSAVRNFRATYSPGDGTVLLQWDPPAEFGKSFRPSIYVRYDEGCPDERTDNEINRFLDFGETSARHYVLNEGPQTLCYLIVPETPYGRRGPGVTATVSVSR